MPILESALIVDDEAHVRVFMKLMLGQLGIRVIYETGKPDEARALFAAHTPGLVTLDINMPGGSGIELLSEFRAADDEAVIVMVSGDVLTGTVKAAADAGADGFIRKDLPREEILAELGQILSN